MSIIFGFILLLNIPQVQNILFDRLVKKISEQTHFTIQHNHFSVRWFHKVLLTDFEIKDPNNRLVCSIDRLKLFFNPIHLVWKRQLLINYIELIQPRVDVLKDKDTTEYNLNTFIACLTTDSASATPGIVYINDILIEKASVNKGALILNDQNIPALHTGFDPYHIQLENIAADLEQLRYKSNALVGDLQHFTASYLEQRLKLHDFSTHFQVTPYTTILNNLTLQTQSSHIQGDFQFSYEGIKTLITAPTDVGFIAYFEKLKLASEELAHFVPYFENHTAEYTAEGKIIGKLNDFYLENFNVEFGENRSNLSGSARLQGLPNTQHTYFKVNIDKSCLHAKDILPHFAQEHHNILNELKLCKIRTTASGTFSHFIAKGNCKTHLGDIGAHMQVNIDKNTKQIAYIGDIKTKSLKIGRLLNIDDLREVTMDAHLDGQGITPETANFTLKSHIKEVGFQKYDYKNIHTDGRFAKAFFRGNVAIEDPNLIVHLDTNIDWRNPKKELFLQGYLSDMALDKLGFTDQSTNLSSEMNITLHGTSWDDFTTNATFNRIQLSVENKSLYLQEVHILNGRQGGCSALKLNSDLLDIQAEGAIKYTALVQDLGTFVSAYQQRLLRSTSSIPKYTKRPYVFKYHLQFKDINPLLHLLAPDIYVAPDTRLEGVFSQQQEVKFEFHLLQLDSLAYNGNQLEKCKLDFIALQDKEDSLLTATVNLTAHKHQWKDYTSTDNFVLNINWINDQISFRNTIGNENNKFQLKLAGEASLKHEGAHFSLRDTSIRLNDNIWELHPASTVSIHDSYIKFHNVLLSNEAQQISVEGKWSSLNPEKLVIGVSNLKLNNLPFFLNRKIDGIAQGTLVVNGKGLESKIDTDIDIYRITIEELMIGDLHAKAAWENSAKCVKLVCELEEARRPVVHITGAYNFSNNVPNIDLVAEFAGAKLATIEPFVVEVFSELKGDIDGRFHIKGALEKPQIYGKCLLKDLKVKLSYLNALYNGKGAISFLENKIQIEELSLADDQQGQADFSGYVYHTYFKNFSLDITGNVRNCKVLNTKSEDNEYLYGRGVVTGDISLTGEIDNLSIIAKATTEKGTSLVIPIRRYNRKIGQEGYIRFVDLKTCKKGKHADLNPIQLKGISLNMDLEITPDASTEIIFNGQDGDIIQSKGKGNLIIKTDSEGSLTVTGNYEFTEGTYNFTVYDVIKRKFKILEGNITWIEDPYEGVLNVKAIYKQRASLAPLLVGTQAKLDDMRNRKKHPVSVLLVLQGEFSAPDIDFDIQIDPLIGTPDLEGPISAFNNRIATDKNYLMNQVFSLVILKAFFADGRVNFRNDTLRSVGELFSQQLSTLATELNENLEIDTDIDLDELRQEKTTSLPIKISYTIFSGRLVVAREGKIDLDAGKETDFANVLGDWTLEYGLTSDNRLKLKLGGYPSGLAASTGDTKPVFGSISFVYVKSFNRWSKIFLPNRHPRYSNKKKKDLKSSNQ